MIVRNDKQFYSCLGFLGYRSVFSVSRGLATTREERWCCQPVVSSISLMGLMPRSFISAPYGSQVNCVSGWPTRHGLQFKTSQDALGRVLRGLAFHLGDMGSNHGRVQFCFCFVFLLFMSKVENSACTLLSDLSSQRALILKTRVTLSSFLFKKQTLLVNILSRVCRLLTF